MIAPPLAILILAAGAARRMAGRDKLTEAVSGQPLLRKITLAALGTGLPVTMALPPDRPDRWAAVRDLVVDRVTVAHPELGMSASLKAGLAALSPDHAVLLLLADLPEIDGHDLTLMAKAQARHPDLILRATSAEGVPGHPVVFPPWAREGLMAIGGDEGARAVLRAHADKVRLIPLPGNHATTDLDTPEDWARWRAAQGISGGE
jgi:CTP:molybdopterin cytidylyltransferase MocA